MDIRFRHYLFIILFTPGVQAVTAEPLSMTEKDDRRLWLPFFEQSAMNVSLKNYWARLNEDEKGFKRIHGAWGQGATATFSSGDIAGILGADISWTRAIKLYASDYFNSRGVLFNSEHQNKKSSAAGYQKFGQRNLRLQYRLADTGLNARVGWMPLKDVGAITLSDRLSMTTYSGWYAGLVHEAFSLQGGIVKKSMSRSSPENTRFTTNTLQPIRSLQTIDMRWVGSTVDLRYAWGESSHYLTRHIFQATVQPMRALTLNGQLYLTSAQKNYRSMPAENRDFEQRAQHITLEALTRSERWQTRWSVSYTSAPKENQVGVYPYHLSKNSRGTFNGMVQAGSDYTRDREKVLSGLVSYQVTPEFTVGLTGNAGRFSYRSVPVTTGEVDFFTRWNPSQKPLSNLSVSTIFGAGWSYKNASGKTPRLKEGHFQRAKTFAGGITAEYKFRLF